MSLLIPIYYNINKMTKLLNPLYMTKIRPISSYNFSFYRRQPIKTSISPSSSH